MSQLVILPTRGASGQQESPTSIPLAPSPGLPAGGNGLQKAQDYLYGRPDSLGGVWVASWAGMAGCGVNIGGIGPSPTCTRSPAAGCRPARGSLTVAWRVFLGPGNGHRALAGGSACSLGR